MTRRRPGILDRRTLNRALLARQWLLERCQATEAGAIEHLVGMQAQVPNAPYVGLWTRLVGFRPEGLARLVTDRSAVRLSMMRSTLHLVTARDCLALRPVLQPVHERMFGGTPYAKAVRGIDRASLIDAARELFAAGPRTLDELGRALARRWRAKDARSMAYAIRTWLPLVQLPPRGVWGASGRPVCDVAEAWLGRPLEGAGAAELEALVLRYLAAFGPATVADLQMWSGLARLRETVERLRPWLDTARDEAGRELFDVPGAPRPDPDAPAPVRFLPEYDNILLGHADRTRILLDEHRARVANGNGLRPCVLVGGFVRATWRLARAGRTAAVEVAPFERLTRKDREAVHEEALALLAFAAPGRAHRVRFAAS
jgi:hypothetical protein